jgi:hypothetical protein
LENVAVYESWREELESIVNGRYLVDELCSLLEKRRLERFAKTNLDVQNAEGQNPDENADDQNP